MVGWLLYLQVEGGYRWWVGCCTYRSKVDIDGGWLLYLQVEGRYRQWVGCCTYRSKADIDRGSADVLASRRRI